MTWNLHDILVFENGRRKEDDPYREDMTTDEQYFVYVDEILFVGKHIKMKRIGVMNYLEYVVFVCVYITLNGSENTFYKLQKTCCDKRVEEHMHDPNLLKPPDTVRSYLNRSNQEICPRRQN